MGGVTRLVEHVQQLRVGVLLEGVEVEAHGAGEEQRLLRDDGDAAAQRVQRHVARVHAVHHHAPVQRPAQAEQRRHQRRLARARAPHDATCRQNPLSSTSQWTMLGVLFRGAWGRVFTMEYLTVFRVVLSRAAWSRIIATVSSSAGDLATPSERREIPWDIPSCRQVPTRQKIKTQV